MLHSRKAAPTVLALIIGLALAMSGSVWATSLGTSITVTGSLTASSTMAISGVSTFYGNVAVNGFATTTASTGAFATESTVGVATSTPGQELGVTGDILTGGTATSALIMRPSTSGVGGCIELLGTDNKTYRIYAGATTSNSGALIVQVGSCK